MSAKIGVSRGIRGEREEPNQPDRPLIDVRCRLVPRSVLSLHPHPSYAKIGLTVPACKLDALVRLGELAFHDPLVIAHSGIIIDGHARLKLASLQGRKTLACIEYEMSDDEALLTLLRTQRKSNYLNSFSRIMLALDLEPSLKEKARLNQCIGGEYKGSSNLTEAAKVNVRAEIAQAADVCDANVSKVKQIRAAAHAELLGALYCGEIQIHRAWNLSKESPEKQIEALRLYRSHRGISKTIRHLISRHSPSASLAAFDPSFLFGRLSALSADELSSVRISLVKMSGKAIFVTEGLVKALESQEELF